MLDGVCAVPTMLARSQPGWKCMCYDSPSRLLITPSLFTKPNPHTCTCLTTPCTCGVLPRAPHMALDCCRYITATEWLTGGNDGALHVWSQMKKKPLAVTKGAHAGSVGGASAEAEGAAPAPPAAGSWAVAGSASIGWVQSVAVCRGSDLVASGAGDGAVRLWQVTQSKFGGAGGLAAVGEVPAVGYVNGLALARSGRFVMAALGQEPRMGRWGRLGGVRNGVLLHPLTLAEGGEESD